VVIAEGRTGVVYANQTGGHATHQREAEGFLIPLPKSSADVLDPDWWDQYRGTFEEAASALERVVRGICRGDVPVRNFGIDDDRNNEEAWVRCSFSLYDESVDPPMETPMKGWLTWPNSD